MVVCSSSDAVGLGQGKWILGATQALADPLLSRVSFPQGTLQGNV